MVSKVKEDFQKDDIKHTLLKVIDSDIIFNVF